MTFERYHSPPKNTNNSKLISITSSTSKYSCIPYIIFSFIHQARVFSKSIWSSLPSPRKNRSTRPAILISPYLIPACLKARTFPIRENDRYEWYRIVYAKNYHETCLVVVADAACGDGSRDGEYCGSVKDHIKALPAGTKSGKLTHTLESEGRILHC